MNVLLKFMPAMLRKPLQIFLLVHVLVISAIGLLALCIGVQSPQAAYPAMTIQALQAASNQVPVPVQSLADVTADKRLAAAQEETPRVAVELQARWTE